MNPPLWSLVWRIPAVLMAVTLMTLVEVNLINALPVYEGPVRTLGGAGLVFLMMAFLPWTRWRR
jgi:hypothetical protein